MTDKPKSVGSAWFNLALTAKRDMDAAIASASEQHKQDRQTISELHDTITSDRARIRDLEKTIASMTGLVNDLRGQVKHHEQQVRAYSTTNTLRLAAEHAFADGNPPPDTMAPVSVELYRKYVAGDCEDGRSEVDARATMAFYLGCAAKQYEKARAARDGDIARRSNTYADLRAALEMLLNETNAGTWDCLPVDLARAALLREARAREKATGSAPSLTVNCPACWLPLTVCECNKEEGE